MARTKKGTDSRTIKGETEQRPIGSIKVLALTLGLKKLKEILTVMKQDDKPMELRKASGQPTTHNVKLSPSRYYR